MNGEEHESPEDQLASWLAECDEALAAGAPAAPMPPTEVTPELQSRLQRGLACIKLLRDVLPRQHAGAADDADKTNVLPTYQRGPGAEALPARLGRYRLEEMIDRGGMGVIVRVRDEDLDRPLALKVLAARWCGTVGMHERFVREARLTGQLQHPGVPPVQELGRLPDGRPYFIMKLVQGKSLKTLLQERHSPGEDLPRWLAIFEQICQPLAFAHSRGIIHRDLKPGNVMVGAFGEVQVMDWGLARVRDEGRGLRDETGTPSFSSLSPHPSSLTHAGQALGTPAYMAPEQARGEVQRLDVRCDVFGLGAILCEILTGQPPWTGELGHEVLRKARQAELDDARRRLANCGADPALIDLASRCLQADPNDRPHDAGAVAQAVTAYQEMVQARLQQAEVAKAAAEAQAQAEQARARTERQRRRLWVALAAVVVILVLAGSGAGVWWVVDRASRISRHELLEADVSAALGQAEQLHEKLLVDLEKPGGVRTLLNRPGDWQARIDTARSAWQRARDRINDAEKPIADELLDQLAALETLLKLNDGNFQVAKWLEKIRDDRSIFVKNELDWAGAAHAYPRAFAQAELRVLPGKEQEDASRIQRSPIKEQLLAALDDWAHVAWKVKDKELNQRLLRIARAADPGLWKDRVRNPVHWHDRQQLQKLARQALNDKEVLKRSSPQMCHLLGSLLSGTTQREVCKEREVWLRQALVLYPGDFWLNLELGAALLQAKQPVQSEFSCRVALAIRSESAAARISLGLALVAQRKYTEAIHHYQQALQIDPKFAGAHVNWGIALSEQKHYGDAARHFQLALQIDPKHALTHHNWGVSLSEQKHYGDAIRHYQLALKTNPNLTDAHLNLGEALRYQGQYTEAMRHFQLAFQIDPNFAQAQINWGAALVEQQQYAEAIRHYQLALTIDRHLANAHLGWGAALAAQKQYAEAIRHYQLALTIDPNHAKAHNNWGAALAEQQQYAEAIRHFQQALTLDPGHVGAHYSLGHVLIRQKQYAEAVSHFGEVLRIDANHVAGQCDLGLALMLDGRFAEAQEATAQALKRMPPGHTLRNRCQRQLLQIQQLLTMDQRLSSVLKGEAQPKDSNEQLSLARLCETFKKYYATAAGFYAAAFAVAPEMATNHRIPHRYNAVCAAALAVAGRGKDAAKLDEPGKAKLRQQSLGWLQADLALCQRRADSNDAVAILGMLGRLTLWQTDPDLAGVRDDKVLAQLPREIQQDWHKLWSDVDSLLKACRARFTELETTQDHLSADQRQKTHVLKGKAGVSYVVDLRSQQFDTLLRLVDAQGQTIAENDDIEPGKDLNSRLIFTLKQDGDYRLIATSSQQQGTGAYTLTIRAFSAAKKSSDPRESGRH
jgi:tetratricopeptide (TPR) repeat protein